MSKSGLLSVVTHVQHIHRKCLSSKAHDAKMDTSEIKKKKKKEKTKIKHKLKHISQTDIKWLNWIGAKHHESINNSFTDP